MDQEEKDKIKKALKIVCEDLDIKDASFCGVTDSGTYMVISIRGTETLEGVMTTIATVGRLWQYARTSMRDILDGFERQ